MKRVRAVHGAFSRQTERNPAKKNHLDARAGPRPEGKNWLFDVFYEINTGFKKLVNYLKPVPINYEINTGFKK